MQKARLICYQLGLERHAAFECAIGQNSRAKTVDGINRSFIKTLQRKFQSALELFSVADSFDDLRDEGPTRLRQRVRDCFPNTTTQFRRRKLRISSYQNLLDRNSLLRQQSQNDGGDRCCLSRARARFDNGEPLFEWSLGGVKFAFHRRLRAEKIGPRTERLLFSHSSSRASSRLRNTSLI